ncbi:hypothetical protein HG535_0A05090 [Zygotorulaspora mrakii]|uniref:tRNA (adenine(58)-N(1))-methyltransferase catalytic subunit TRM61 n=1 Tax=Zygotorulaspora mrakii TaxID=42260 RepID=A0A7H9AW04_ZYGMR|nr:uncharacterized protein HG535_0A05090 [Zygotorulaspora mrakii]QLG70568.1 hypothetical protein HG535_0A05090 [Zygotorulaspora mrakii]
MKFAFEKFDIVLARSLSKPGHIFHLSKPLQSSLQLNCGNGTIAHDDIIGKNYRSLVVSSNDHKYIIVKPTLEEYIVNRRREAQPIYSLDAALIVQLSDILVHHPQIKQTGSNWCGLESLQAPSRYKRLNLGDPFDNFLNDKLQQNGSSVHSISLVERPKQFLECGTGHGSLTLNILKAVHGANCYYDGVNDLTRGAILHSLDKNAKHLNVGMQNVKHYEKGILWPDVEFHLTNSPNDWLEGEDAKYYRERLAQSANRFLSGVFLDMPSPELQLSKLSEALYLDCPLIVFVPSITQIWDCLSFVKTNGVKLTLTKTYELTPGSGGGGMREWDLRRSLIRESGAEGIVMRPKVGTRVVGGGFVGVFRKLPNDAIVKTWD